jgi:hypothetical protein
MAYCVKRQRHSPRAETEYLCCMSHMRVLLLNEIAKRGVFLEQGDFCRRQVFIHPVQASRLKTRPFRRQQEWQPGVKAN